MRSSSMASASLILALRMFRSFYILLLPAFKFSFGFCSLDIPAASLKILLLLRHWRYQAPPSLPRMPFVTCYQDPPISVHRHSSIGVLSRLPIFDRIKADRDSVAENRTPFYDQGQSLPLRRNSLGSYASSFTAWQLPSSQ